ncbi:MAG: OmpA family protein [Moraxella sp.]|nr:OmpA family protein [Moraxella sp.]
MKMVALTALAVAVVGLTGCMGTKHLSHNISDEGRVASRDDIVFPALDKAWEKGGIFPNSENLSKIRQGVDKDELYQLIGRPHFSEANRAREWDYIFKFYQNDGSVKICQYKIIFDKAYIGQEFYWLPADCAAYATGALSVKTSINSEKITLEADALFAFDKWQLSDMSSTGRAKLDNLAKQLVQWEQKGDSRVSITGYTDRLGDDMYNANLSTMRAQTVRQYLISRGVSPTSISASGAGKSNPVVECNQTNRTALESCLQPNRRVEVLVDVFAK